MPGQIAEDSVRNFFEQLALLPTRPIDKLDIFLCSNGGEGTVPWRLISLFREYASNIGVLIPYRAYSAATLLALGADEILMHPFAELGPIDPTVSNDYNPIAPDGSGRRLGISVEDVKAYVSFIKTTVGITHEDELIKAIEILVNNVHPLALGNVERFILQSRMIARKILKTHMSDKDDHVIAEIIETMASKLFFHGHPINRKEARDDLKLKVSDPQPELETAMWNLFLDFEGEFENLVPFHPGGDIATDLLAVPVGTAPPQIMKRYDLLHALIESERLSSVYKSTRNFILAGVQPGGQMAIREDILSQGWSHTPAP